MARLTKREEEISKLQEAQRKCSVQCVCSNRVPFGAFKRFGNYAICGWCGRRVYKTIEEQNAYEFRATMETLLKRNQRRGKNGRKRRVSRTNNRTN